MINIIICDDEAAPRQHLLSLTQRWARENAIDVSFTQYENAEQYLFSVEHATCKTADIFLLDVQMGAMDGVTLARKIRSTNKEAQIIFVTGYTEYIADGYEVEALHYLIKPATAEKLFAVLDRAREKLALAERVIFVQHGGTSTRLPLYAIRYMEVRHNHVTIHADNKFTVKTTLGELEKQLADDPRFFRVGRSFIINLNGVAKTTRTDVHLRCGAVIPLPRGAYDTLNRAIIQRL
ncbi:MAG: LytTR family DNA-binding domain-containing protein [Defluviitaleaceae bacterium]|nr:LytTR family DNA-binding domain-containing protein [Defluviitaleaceae bacterium]